MRAGSLLAHGRKLGGDVVSSFRGTPHFAFCPESVSSDVFPVDFETHLEAGSFAPLDAHGIPVAHYLHADNQYNPTRVAGYGLALFNRFRRTRCPEVRSRFLNVADWFARQEDGRFEYRYWIQELAPPWVSAMAQGQGISILTRGYRLTGRAGYLETALRAMAPFHDRIPQGGVRSHPDEGFDFLEEFPTRNPFHTLNGFLYAVIGILDLTELRPEAGAKLRFDRILKALDHLDRWTVPGWSLYDLHQAGGHPCVATVPYHRMHITQLRYLSARLGDPDLAERCRAWEAQLQDPGRRLAALFRKIRYRLASPSPLPHL